MPDPTSLTRWQQLLRPLPRICARPPSAAAPVGRGTGAAMPRPRSPRSRPTTPSGRSSDRGAGARGPAALTSSESRLAAGGDVALAAALAHVVLVLVVFFELHAQLRFGDALDLRNGRADGLEALAEHQHAVLLELGEAFGGVDEILVVIERRGDLFFGGHRPDWFAILGR